LCRGSEEIWYSLSVIAEINLNDIDFQADSLLRRQCRNILNTATELLQYTFFRNHPKLYKIKNKITILNHLVNTPGAGNAQLNVHDAKLSPIRQIGRAYLKLYAADIDKTLASKTWLASYRKVLDEIIENKPVLKNYMDFLYKQEEASYKHTTSRHLGVSKTLVKAWYLSQNKHGEDKILDINLIISALIDSSKVYEGGIGIFPGLPYSCHPGTQERIETSAGVFLSSFENEQIEKSVEEQYSKYVTQYVSKYICLLGKETAEFQREDYSSYTFNKSIEKYILLKAAKYRFMDDQLDDVGISQHIFDDLSRLHAPVSKSFLFHAMFREHNKSGELNIKSQIENLACITETPREEEVDQLQSDIDRIEDDMRKRVSSLQKSYEKMSTALDNLQPNQKQWEFLIFTTLDEIKHLSSTNNPNILGKIFPYLGLKLYTQCLDDPEISTLMFSSSIWATHHLRSLKRRPELMESLIDSGKLTQEFLELNVQGSILHFLIEDAGLIECLSTVCSKVAITKKMLLAKDGDGMTVLDWAASLNWEALKILIKMPAFTEDMLMHPRGGFGRTALHSMAVSSELLAKLCEQKKLTVDMLMVKDARGQAPLHIAMDAPNGEQVECVKVLLKSGLLTKEILSESGLHEKTVAIIDEKSVSNMVTKLFLFAQRSPEIFIEFLKLDVITEKEMLEEGFQGNRLLHIAAQSPKVLGEVLEKKLITANMLLEADINGNNPLHIAPLSSFTKLQELLNLECVSIDMLMVMNMEGMTPLHIAINNSKTDTILLMTVNKGETIIHSIAKDYPAILEDLLALENAMITEKVLLSKNLDGESLLSFIQKPENKESMNRLIKVHLKDFNGFLPCFRFFLRLEWQFLYKVIKASLTQFVSKLFSLEKPADPSSPVSPTPQAPNNGVPGVANIGRQEMTSDKKPSL